MKLSKEQIKEMHRKLDMAINEGAEYVTLSCYPHLSGDVSCTASLPDGKTPPGSKHVYFFISDNKKLETRQKNEINYIVTPEADHENAQAD